jgi:hypothetical protein
LFLCIHRHYFQLLYLHLGTYMSLLEPSQDSVVTP